MKNNKYDPIPAANADDAPQPDTHMPAGPSAVPDNEPRLHKGHRDRLRSRFRAGSAEAMASHELLELMLTYVHPRVDVNPTAHRLIERFGSLSGVLSASEDELTAVRGVGPETALLIRLTAAIRRAADLEAEAQTAAPILNSISRVVAYARPLFKDEPTECIRLLLLNNRMQLIECRRLATGTVNSAHLCVRKVAEAALFKRASCVILLHNHPSGNADPSEADLDMTRRLISALEPLGIELKEHIVIAPYDAVAILNNRRCTDKPDVNGPASTE